METPERLDNLPSTPEPSEQEASTSCNIEEARLTQLKSTKGICVICYSSIKEGKKCFPENCLHIFHFDCLQRWSEQKNQCPLCKKGKYELDFMEKSLKICSLRVKKCETHQIQLCSVSIFILFPIPSSIRPNYSQHQIKDGIREICSTSYEATRRLIHRFKRFRLISSDSTTIQFCIPSS